MMRSTRRRGQRNACDSNADSASSGAENNSISASAPETASQQMTPMLADSSDSPVMVDVGNGFIAVTSSHSKNSKRSLPRGNSRLPFHRGGVSRGSTSHRNIQHDGSRQPGIQPIPEGQVPTSLRSHLNVSYSTPLYPLRPMQFPLAGYEFRLACTQCFKDRSFPVDIMHTCREEFLIVCNKNDGLQRWKLIREPQNPYGVRRYTLCRNIGVGINCYRGDSCWYAHSVDECQLWNMQNGGLFRIGDFIASNRTPGTLSRFTVDEVFGKHPGTLDVICKACFRLFGCWFEPQDVTKEMCSRDLHSLRSSRVLAHRAVKTRHLTLIDSRPFKAKTAYFNFCRYGRYCRKNVRCTFAHNVIEYDLWYLQRDGDLNEEDILKKWQMLSGALACTDERPSIRNVSQRSVSESHADSFTPSYSNIAARKQSTVSESSAGITTQCPFSITRACAVCIHVGHLSGRVGDRCMRNHLWDMNKIYVILPSRKEVRGIPQQIPRRRRAKFYLCKMAKRDCRYGSQCVRAHNEHELQLWNWMAANNVYSLEAIVQSGEARSTPRSVPSPSFTQPGSVSAAGEGPWLPVLQQAEWVCEFCSYYCSSQNEFLRHSSSVTHQFNMNSDKEHQWNFRQPPWNVRGGSYRLCQKHEQGQSCRYSHVLPNRNYCTFAHSSDELDEWKERFKWREMKKKAVAEDNLYSYMAKLVKDYKESGCEVISEEIADVRVECTEPLSVTSENKLKVKEWTFTINSEVHDLQTVALLYEEEFLHFALVGPDLEENCQIADGEVFQTEDSEYRVKVKFTGGLFRSFHQWVVFDFGLRPVLVRKLSVELGQPDICEQLLSLKEEMNFNRWTSLNRKIVKFRSDLSNPDSFADELLGRYKEPSIEAIKLQRLSQTQLNASNYKHRMHALIDLEELAQAKIISTSSRFDVVTIIKVTNCISDEWGGTQYSHSGQLFATVNLGNRLLEGSLMASTSVSTAFVGSKDGLANGFVYEAEICKIDGERALKGKDYVYLTLSKKCCEDMKLKDGDTVEAEIQFQLNRLTFCRMHYGIDQLNNLDLLFVDSRRISAPSAWDPKYNIDLSSSELNEDQKKVIKYVSVRRQQLTWPLVVYGPFGTGKTKTLADAAFLLTTQNVGAMILICTWTNHAADEYVLRYFHQMGPLDLGVLRIYDKSRRMNTVDRQILPYCLVSSQGNASSFREPTAVDIQNSRIVVTTLETSLVVTRLNLRGHFTHIFIDEAAQALECHAIMPLCLADEKTSVVLAGDHIQMAQQVHSEEAIRQNFGVSLAERMICGYFGLPAKNNPAVLFSTNYRNHPEIVRFVARIFYGGEDSLKSAGAHSPVTVFPPLAFRYARRGEEVQHKSSTSFYNAAEIYEMMELIDDLLRNWPASWGDKRPSDILVTTAYDVQVKMMREMFKRHGNRDLSQVAILKVQNVPGREFRAVFISTVRTIHLLADPEQIDDLAYGFLSDEKLLNSALTRARSSVTVVGDPVALCGIGRCSKIWREYMKHCTRLKSISPPGLDINFIRLRVDAMTRGMVAGNEGDNQPEDWNEDFQLPEDEITQRLRI